MSKIFETSFSSFGYSWSRRARQLSPRKFNVSLRALIVLRSSIFPSPSPFSNLTTFSPFSPFSPFLGLFCLPSRACLSLWGEASSSGSLLRRSARSSRWMLMLWWTLMSLSKRKLLETVPSSRQGAFLRLEYRQILAGFLCERKTSVLERILRSQDCPCAALASVLTGRSSLQRRFSFSVATRRSGRRCLERLNSSLAWRRSRSGVFLAVLAAWVGEGTGGVLPREAPSVECGLLRVFCCWAVLLKICSVSRRGGRLGEARICWSLRRRSWMYCSMSTSSSGMKCRSGWRSQGGAAGRGSASSASEGEYSFGSGACGAWVALASQYYQNYSQPTQILQSGPSFSSHRLTTPLFCNKMIFFIYFIRQLRLKLVSTSFQHPKDFRVV